MKLLQDRDQKNCLMKLLNLHGRLTPVYIKFEIFNNFRIQVKFVGNYLKQDKLTLNHFAASNIHIVYGLHLWTYGCNYTTLKILCL